MTEWLAPWDFSLTAAGAIVLAAAFYGCQSGECPRWQKACFWTGLFSIYAVLLTRFDFYAEHEFFMGRVQQAVLQHVGPFLMALGLPAAWQQKIAKTRVLDFLFHPLIAAFLFDAVMLVWLIPAVHFVAMIDGRLYRAMNDSMVLSGLLFWGSVLSPRSRHSPGLRIVMMLAVAPAQIVTGLLITFAPRELYPVYSLCGRAFDGIAPLADQQIGGMILWIHGAMMSAIGVLIVARREFRNN